MSVQLAPPLIDLLGRLGMQWPQFDEDSGRAAAQAWTDALGQLVRNAQNGNTAAVNVNYSVQSTSADAFNAYWQKWTDGDQSYLGGAATQAQQLAANLIDASNEAEFAKIAIGVQLTILAMQLAVDIALAFFTDGVSLAESAIAMRITQSVIGRILLNMVTSALMAVAPDAVADYVEVVQGRKVMTGADWQRLGTDAGTGALFGLVAGGLHEGLNAVGGDWARTTLGPQGAKLATSVTGGALSNAVFNAGVWGYNALRGNGQNGNETLGQAVGSGLLTGGFYGAVFGALPERERPVTLSGTFDTGEGNRTAFTATQARDGSYQVTTSDGANLGTHTLTDSQLVPVASNGNAASPLDLRDSLLTRYDPASGQTTHITVGPDGTATPALVKDLATVDPNQLHPDSRAAYQSLTDRFTAPGVDTKVLLDPQGRINQAVVTEAGRSAHLQPDPVNGWQVTGFGITRPDGVLARYAPDGTLTSLVDAKGNVSAPVTEHAPAVDDNPATAQETQPATEPVSTPAEQPIPQPSAPETPATPPVHAEAPPDLAPAAHLAEPLTSVSNTAPAEPSWEQRQQVMALAATGEGGGNAGGRTGPPRNDGGGNQPPPAGGGGGDEPPHGNDITLYGEYPDDEMKRLVARAAENLTPAERAELNQQFEDYLRTHPPVNQPPRFADKPPTPDEVAASVRRLSESWQQNLPHLTDVHATAEAMLELAPAHPKQEKGVVAVAYPKDIAGFEATHTAMYPQQDRDGWKGQGVLTGDTFGLWAHSGGPPVDAMPRALTEDGRFNGGGFTPGQSLPHNRISNPSEMDLVDPGNKVGFEAALRQEVAAALDKALPGAAAHASFDAVVDELTRQVNRAVPDKFPITDPHLRQLAGDLGLDQDGWHRPPNAESPGLGDYLSRLRDRVIGVRTDIIDEALHANVPDLVAGKGPDELRAAVRDVALSKANWDNHAEKLSDGIGRTFGLDEPAAKAVADAVRDKYGRTELPGQSGFRDRDAEAKLVAQARNVLRGLGDPLSITGTLVIAPNKEMCYSCQDLVTRLQAEFPNLRVVIGGKGAEYAPRLADTPGFVPNPPAGGYLRADDLIDLPAPQPDPAPTYQQGYQAQDTGGRPGPPISAADLTPPEHSDGGGQATMLASAGQIQQMAPPIEHQPTQPLSTPDPAQLPIENRPTQPLPPDPAQVAIEHQPTQPLSTTEPSHPANLAPIPDPRRITPHQLVELERQVAGQRQELALRTGDRLRAEQELRAAYEAGADPTRLHDLAERAAQRAQEETRVATDLAARQHAVEQARKRLGLPPTADSQAPSPTGHAALDQAVDLTRQRMTAHEQQAAIRAESRRLATEIAHVEATINDPDRTLPRGPDPLAARLADLRQRAAQLDRTAQELAARQHQIDHQLGGSSLLDTVTDLRQRLRAIEGDQAAVRAQAQLVAARIADVQARLDDPDRTTPGGPDPLADRLTDLRRQADELGQRAQELDNAKHVANGQLDNALKHGDAQGNGTLRTAIQVGGKEVPYMMRYKRVLTFVGEVLEDQVRDGNLTPLLRDDLRGRLDAARALLETPQPDYPKIEKTLDVLEHQIQRSIDGSGLDARMRAYAGRLLTDLRAQAHARAANPDLPIGATTHHGALLEQPATTVSQRSIGKLGVDVVETPDGARYLRFKRLINKISYEESPLGAVRPSYGADLNDPLTELIEHATGHRPALDVPLVKLGPIGLGGSVGFGSKLAVTPGHEFAQELNRGDTIGIKLSGRGPRVIVDRWDDWPAKEKQQDPLTFDATHNLVEMNKVTIKSDVEVSPAVFVDGLPKSLEAPVHAKVSLEVGMEQKDGKPWEPKINATIEFVAGDSKIGDAVKALLGAGANPLGQQVLSHLDISSETAFVIGPVDVVKDGPRFGRWLVDKARDMLTEHGLSLDALPPADAGNPAQPSPDHQSRTQAFQQALGGPPQPPGSATTLGDRIRDQLSRKPPT